MPYIWTPVHGQTYTEPPGKMSFIDDWGLNPIYDETSNPDPVTQLIFTIFTDFSPDAADVSLSRSTPRYFGAGYVWLSKNHVVSDNFFEEIRYTSQYLFNHNWIYIKPISAVTFSANRFDILDLWFNPAKITSVRVEAYPPPVWQDP